VNPDASPASSSPNPDIRDDYQLPEQIAFIVLMGLNFGLLAMAIHNLLLSRLVKKAVNSRKLMAINSIIGIHAIVRIAFFSDAILMLVDKTGFTPITYVFIDFLALIFQSLVMTLAAYYWISLLLLLNNQNFNVKSNLAKGYLCLMVGCLMFMLGLSILMLCDQSFINTSFTILRYCDLVIGSLSKIVFAALCLLLVSQLKQFYGFKGSHLTKMKILGIVCFFGTIADMANDIYYMVLVDNPNSLENLGNSGVTPDVYIWTGIICLVYVLSEIIPMLFSLIIFKPIKANKEQDAKQSMLSSQGDTNSKTALMGNKSTFAEEKDCYEDRSDNGRNDEESFSAAS